MSLIKASGRTFVEELATNPQVNLMVVCERLGAPFNDGEQRYLWQLKLQRNFMIDHSL